MRAYHLEPLMEAMRGIGTDLLTWRNDENARKIHSRAEMKLEADRRAHARLSEALHTEFPNIPIISEEDGQHSKDRPSLYWLIDPIDGTASWYHGFDGFVTQAALVEDGRAIAGLVYAPAQDRFFTAQMGHGAQLNGSPLPFLGERDSLIMTDNTPQPHGITERLGHALPSTGYLESGSLGLKSCLVTCGDADVFVKDVVVRDWDMAPAMCLLEELGGCLMKLDGKPFALSGAWEKHEGFVVARNEAMALRVIETYKTLAMEN